MGMAGSKRTQRRIITFIIEGVGQAVLKKGVPVSSYAHAHSTCHGIFTSAVRDLLPVALS